MKKGINLFYQSATELVSLLANRQISSAELVEETISRITQFDKKVNAIPVRDFERALAAAKLADTELTQGKRLPLLGLPMTVKESFNVTGLPTTWGNPHYKEWFPKEDSLVIQRLKAAGAIIVGKSNVPFMLGDWQSYNEIYGTTNNPWNTDMTPGGSSGGSAAALAAGFVSLELGSDLAGSLRVPAHYCGVYAHKPTFGIVPLTGVAPPSNPSRPGYFDFVVAGPMARTAADLELELNVLAGPDQRVEGKGYKLSLPAPRHVKLNYYRVLMIDNHPVCPTTDSVKASIHQIADQLITKGVSVKRHAQQLPDLASIAHTYGTLLAAFMSMNVTNEIYQSQLLAAKELKDDDVSSYGCYLRGATFSHRDWLVLSRARAQLYQAWRDLYKEFDVVICPVMPTPAFAHDHSDVENRKININGEMISFWDQKAWPSIATLFGLPATVVPITQTKDGLPVGMQIIGDYLEDYTTIQFAKLLEREFGGFKIPTQ